MLPGNVVAVIQARMGSTRLPGKVMADIEGYPMLWHVVTRARQARLVSDVIVATSIEKTDDRVADYCKTNGFRVFRGSETDVLDRYYQAAKLHSADAIVRITADCPLIDPDIVDIVIRAYRAEGCDYAANILVRTYPHGLDTEVFSFAALEAAWRDARNPAEREHVTPFLRSSGRFRLYNVQNEIEIGEHYYRWTVDEPRDLEFVRAVYAHFGATKPFGWREVLDLLDANPELAQINSSLEPVR